MADVKWTKEQQDAIYDKGSNILVAAAAGSGKTAVLVERIINKVINENVDIDKILVVTFTNAAASEMRERILEAIYKKMEEFPDNKNLQRQIILINKASICTIDSFCLDIIRNNFFEIDTSANFRVADTTEVELLKQEVIDDIFEDKYVSNDKEFLNLINTYFTTDKVRNSEFFEEYYKYYGRIKNTPAYALDISEIEVRHIRSVDIIPKSLYDKNEERYEFIKKQLEVEKDTVKKIKLLEELSENVVSIPYYDFDRTKNCKDIKINGRHYYWVLDCKYDSKIGFKADRNKQNYATFW